MGAGPHHRSTSSEKASQLHLFDPPTQESGGLHALSGQQRSFLFVPHGHSQPLLRSPSQSSWFGAQAL
jgi:hypothetical protein